MSDTEFKVITDRLDRIERLALIGSKNVLDLEETAVLTGLSKGHLYRLTSDRQIPHFKKNRKLYFSKKEVEDWMLEHRVQSESDIESKAENYLATHKRH